MELKAGYKQTEVGVIPEDWGAVSIGSLLPFITSGSRGWAEFYSEQGDIFVRIANLSRESIYLDLSNLRFVELPINSKEGLRTELKEGDVLVSITADIGISGYISSSVPKPAYINQHIALIRFDLDKVNSKYISYFLASETPQKLFRTLTDSGAKAGMNLSTVQKICLSLPPTKTEQTAIANVLSDADALIQSLTRLIVKKRQIKQGAMQTLLNPYENGRLKEGGVVRKLGEIANIYRGASPRPIDSPVWFDENSEIGWVRISDVTKAKKYLQTTLQKLSKDGIKQSRYVSSGNLIMSICATVGRPILLEMDVCIHDGFVVFDSCNVDKQYLYYFLTSIEQDWSKHGQTGSQMNLNTGLINATVLPVPESSDDQTRIATILSDMDAEIAALESKLAKYQQIKQGMMQNLLTGKIRLVKP